MVVEFYEKTLWSSVQEDALSVFLEHTKAGHLVEAFSFLEEMPEGERMACLEQIDAWAERLRERIHDALFPAVVTSSTSAYSSSACSLPYLSHDALEPVQQVEMMRHLLVEEMDFSGERQDYHHPKNSKISSVLQRRRGLPISLAAIWIEVGQRAGLSVEGIGMPNHFLIRVGGREGCFVDVFRDGKILSVEACKTLFVLSSKGRTAWDDAFLAPVSSQQILERILRNLIQAHIEQEDYFSLYRAARFLCALTPEDPIPFFLCVHVAKEAHDPEQALADCDRIVERFPSSPASSQALAQRIEIEDSIRLMN